MWGSGSYLTHGAWWPSKAFLEERQHMRFDRVEQEGQAEKKPQMKSKKVERKGMCLRTQRENFSVADVY